MPSTPEFAEQYGSEALDAGATWAASMMSAIPTDRRMTVITRVEYEQLLCLAYAKGYSDRGARALQ